MTQFVEQLRNQAKWYAQPGHNACDLMDSRLLKKAADEIERLEKAVKEWRDRCTNLLDFIEHAPVSSGVCCCGEDMENHVSSDHSPVDQWSWNIHLWSREVKTAIKNMEDAI